MSITKIEKVLLTGKTRTTINHPAPGTRSAGERVNLKLTSPGSPEYDLANIQAHPTAEQLFAGAWSACYISALGLVAQSRKLTLPKELAVNIEVDLGMAGSAYFLQARLAVRMPGFAHEVAEAIAHEADQICPYSKATRGNIDVALSVSVD